MVSVTLENVTKRFDSVIAVDRVSLEVEEGEFFFLLGPSGYSSWKIFLYQPWKRQSLVNSHRPS